MQSEKSKFTNIPFFKQTEGEGNCLQANLKMVLEFYYPHKDYTFDQLDHLTGRTPGKWTWTSQALIPLINEGLDVYYYSTTPYQGILEKGENFIIESYGEIDGRIMIERTNFDLLYSSIETLKETNRYEAKKLDFATIEQEFQKCYLILVAIDKAVLENRDLPYTGHIVTITDINQTHVTFHDSEGTPNRTVRKPTFINAWNAKGTDNDVMIIKGIIKQNCKKS